MNFYILAGGQSRRMGRNKALIRFEDTSVIEHVMSSIPASREYIKVVTNDPKPFDFLSVALIADTYPNLGPISGVHAGLLDSSFQFNFFIACDMPLVSTELVKFLLSRHKDEDIFGLRSERGAEPLCAIYSKNCVSVIEEQIGIGNYSLHDLFKKVPSNFVEPPDSAQLFNMNTPLDLEKLKSQTGLKKKNKPS